MESVIRIKTNIRNLLVTIGLSGFIGVSAFGQLSGTKTINPSGGNYSSFTNAISDLVSQGINGPVVFNVANGTYNEQVTIPEISGSSAVNTITFQSVSGDSASVVLSFNSTSASSNYTLRLNNSDYINIKKISIQATGSTYGRAVELMGNATNILIESCRIIGFNTTGGYSEHTLIYSYRVPLANINIQKNHLSGSNYGIYIEGVNSTTLSAGTKITGNTFIDQRTYGIYLEAQDAPFVNSNNIQLKNPGDYGIYMQYCDNAIQIQKNKIILPGGQYGIYLYLSDGNLLSRGLIVNNSISITGGSTASGIYLSNSTYQNIWHNSVNISGITTNDNGSFFLTGGSNVDVRNNIFANSGENYAYNIKTPAALEYSDYNNYYSNGPFLAYWDGKREDLTQLKSAQTVLKDINSISFNPVFVSPTDLHGGSFRIDNKGINLGITQDIDGQTRTNYDIGSDEFTGSGSALAGAYTIGGSSPSFASFSLAAAALNSYGISGNVTFNVRNGTYNEQFTLQPVAGAGPSSQVIFQSESNDSTKVELSFNSGSANNYIVRFTGADHITFRKLGLTALNPTYSRIFWFHGSSFGNTIVSCILNGNSGGSTGDALIYAYEGNVNNLTISGNVFNAGRYGVYLNSINVSKSTGTKIIGNSFLSQKGSYPNGIYLRYHDAPEVSTNFITNTLAGNYYGIVLQDCINDFKVIGNKISSFSSDGGIQLYDCKSINTKRGLVANNFIDIGGTSTAWGIYTYGAEFLNIYHNSVRITSTSLTDGRAFHNAGNSNNLNIRNNLFTNYGDGYAFYNLGSTVNFASDYNAFYSTGNYPVYWNSVNHATFLSYKTAASPLDSNSKSVNPVFISLTDLHALSSFVNNAGTPLPEVTTDIDNQIRNVSTPDIGADEFSSPLLPLAGGTYTIGGATPNYANFSAAVNDLNTKGISGPIVFNIRDGIYNEQIRIFDINGSSAVNTVLFQSQSQDSTKVELSFSANVNSRHVIQLTGTDNITFRKMTISALNPSYSLVFFLGGGIERLNIKNCILNGSGSTGNEYNSSVVYSGNGSFAELLIENSLFTGGRSGIWMESPAAGQSSGTQIINNRFTGQNYDAIYLRYHDAPKIEKNNIDNTTLYTYFSGISLAYCNNDFLIQGNYITAPAGNSGIFVSYCIGNTTKRGLIANNLIDVGGNYYSNGISTENSSYLRVFSNSVRITSPEMTGGRSYNNVNGSNLEIQNNIFANLGGGYAYYSNTAAPFISSDYNNLFTIGNYLAYLNANSINISTFKTLSGRENNSVSVNPVFTSLMHTSSYFLNNKGVSIASVSKDFDGESRNASTPDIGADEFEPTLNPLAGNYTIGGTSPSVASFTLAAEALNERGISGPVVFNVRNGTYNEQFVLFEITGSSPDNKIVFQSESGDSSAVVLSYNSSSASANYLVKLIGTDHLTFKKMTIAGTHPSFSNLFVLNGNVSHLQILNNVLSLNINSTSTAITSPDGYVLNSILIKNNKFLSGGYGVILNGNNSLQSDGIEISKNLFENQKSSSIRLDDMNSPLIKGNNLTSTIYSYEGIYLYNCNNKLEISNNQIYSENYSVGLSISSCNGTLVNQGIIANNFISIAGSSYATGISFSASQYQNVVYNSVNIASTLNAPTSKYAFYLTSGDNIFVRNNVFSCASGGYAYYVSSPASVDASDFNDYFSTSDLAYWNGARTNLAALRTANGMDAASLSVNPGFASVNDLRVGQALLHRAATPLSYVLYDFFGNIRDAVKPDIGATEYSCSAPVFDISASSSCFGDSTVFTYAIANVSLGSDISVDFDNDFNPDASFTNPVGIIKHMFSSSGAKTVNFIVTQIAGCNDYISESITVEPSPVVEVIATGTYCGNNDGSATLNILQGSGPFIYNWSNGSKNDNLTNLSKGLYSVTVANENNCFSTNNFEIGDRMTTTVTSVTPSTCGKTDGSAIVSVSGGVEPYAYVWSNGETQATALKLSSGAHYVNVTDASGCTSVGSVNISTDGSGPKITLKTVSHNKCYGDKSGALDVNLTGGAQPYSIQWSNGAVTEDLTNLASGIYDVLLTDNSGCQASASFSIDQPVFLNISTVTEDASCNGTDGKAVALAGGGAKPYNYLWSNGAAGPVAQNLSAGIYTITLTDNNNCSVVTPVLINNTGGPKIALNNLKGVNCTNAAIGSIDIQISGGTPLYTYSWLPGGQTSQDINNLTEGIYEVRVTDNAGCVGVNSFVLGIENPAVNPICLVTVDSITGKNLIIWEKLNQPEVVSFNIYRESSSKGIFQLIASKPYADVSEYLDEIADPSLRSWRYKISAVDNCGNESELSDAHKTIHLTQNVGLNRKVNLIWDKYEGFITNSYKILRYSKAEGWITLATIPGDLTSFTDDKATIDEDLYYEIEVENPNGSCTSLKASTHNTSRSNRQSTNVSSTLGLINYDILNSIAVYPNPARNEFTLSLNQQNLKRVAVEIIDSKGQIMRNFKYSAQSDDFSTIIGISDISEGVYILRVSSDTNVNFVKLVIRP